MDQGEVPRWRGRYPVRWHGGPPHRDEVEALLGVAHKSNWGDEMAIILHHIPESEESKEGYAPEPCTDALLSGERTWVGTLILDV
jgi:hypothetical protein